MIAPTSRIVSLHSARISESGDAVSIYLVDAGGRLCSVDVPLDELMNRSHVVDPGHIEAHERALDVAAAAGLRAALRERFGGL